MEPLTPTNGLRIEKADERQLPLILSFIKELAEYERLGHEVLATEDLLRDALFGAHPAAEVLIAYDADAPAGFALFFHNLSTFLGQRGLYLEDLYVRPQLRGKGIGRALLSRLAQMAKERNCGRLEWVVLNWNEPAIRFYQSIGALPMEEWTTFRLTGEALDHLAQGPR
jgi:GNAT superfamily N-acetyltransferase